jgi:isopenicillin N synthase-like dioxygenase
MLSGYVIAGGEFIKHESLKFFSQLYGVDKSSYFGGGNVWPAENMLPGFREAYERWIQKMKRVGYAVMEAYVVNLCFYDVHRDTYHTESQLGSVRRMMNGCP